MFVRDIEYHQIQTSELKVLLTYAEADIHDITRKASGFELIKVIPVFL